MIGHQLVGQDAAWVSLKPLGKNISKRLVIGNFLKDCGPAIASIQGMLDRISLVRALRSGPSIRLAAIPNAEKSPDTFSSSSRTSLLSQPQCSISSVPKVIDPYKLR